jgi:phosphoribosylformimino-5-aminoimidazole carboxamide ribotide isomerase
VGVDCESGIVATHGWQERSEMSALHFVHLLKDRGVRRIVYTDVLRDGMLEGPNLEGLHELTEATELEVVMSGGISRLEDLRWVKREAPDVVAIIVGRALYEGAFTLEQAKAALA